MERYSIFKEIKLIETKEISTHYLKNLSDLIFNDLLDKELEKNNITLYL